MLIIKTHLALILLLFVSEPDSLRSRWQLCRLTDAAYPLRVLRWIPVWVRNGSLCLGSERTVQKREIGYACPPLLMRFNAHFCKQETGRKRRRYEAQALCTSKYAWLYLHTGHTSGALVPTTI